MSMVWSEKTKFDVMLYIENEYIKCMSVLGIIPEGAYGCLDNIEIDLNEINKLEEITKHDVFAFIKYVAITINNDYSKYVHLGLTSSDVVDTYLSISIVKSIDILISRIDVLISSMEGLHKKYGMIKCVGRTHGVHAGIMLLGQKIKNYTDSIKRCKCRLIESRTQMNICKISGPLGNYSTVSKKTEIMMAGKLKMKIETSPTQVIPRDRHAEVACDVAIMGSCLDKIACDIRHMNQTEIMEMAEGFKNGQKGSSSMPHKKNPITCEKISGMSRLLRGYCISAMENVSLWYERDISHSSVERVIFPDMFSILDHMVISMTDIFDNVIIKTENMTKNMELTKGRINSAEMLSMLIIDLGYEREEAHKLLQEISEKDGDMIDNIIKFVKENEHDSRK